MAATATKSKNGGPPSRRVKRLAQSDSEPRFVRVSEFAKRFAMSVSAVYKAIEAGTIEAIQLPGTGDKIQIRIPFSEVTRVEAGRLKKRKAG
jgi:hypothetical protein